MRTIEIADDVYDHLRSRIVVIGEDVSSILRRDFGLAQPGSNGTRGERIKPAEEPATPLDEFLAGSKLRAQRNATDRFVELLRFAYSQQPDEFERVLEIGGRRRRYFGRTHDEVDRSGTSVSPRRIPGSPYWVMTNAPTSSKKGILISVLKVLGYSAEQATRASWAISDTR